MENFDARQEKAENALKPLLTDEFLQTLCLAVKTCGWGIDHTESVKFVEWCFDLAGQSPPDLTTPFDYSDK